MDPDDIRLLYDYNRWANRRVLARAAELPPERLTEPTAFPWGDLRGTLAHILDSEYVWRNLCQHRRFAGRLTDVEAFPTLQSIAAYWAGEEGEMRAYLDGLRDSDLEDVVRYDAGTPRARVLWHCLVHVVNHGTQHRSECAAMLKGFGGNPVGLDLTLYLNERG